MMVNQRDKTILVYDQAPAEADLRALSKETYLELFALTSDYKAQDTLKAMLESCGIQFRELNSAKIIDQVIETHRLTFIEWIAGLGEKKIIKGKSLKEYFLFPDRKISGWWLSIISEKNVIKSNQFFKIFQAVAVIDQIRSGGYTKVLLCINDREFLSVIENHPSKKTARFVILRPASESADSNKRERPATLVGSCLAALYLLYNKAKCGYYSRKKLGAIKLRGLLRGDPLLFVTDFPSLDKGVASRGIFKNKYTPHLQDLLSAKGKNILWGLMYVQYQPYAEAVDYALSFQKKGYRLFFIDEFLTFGAIAGVIRTWINQICKYLIVSRRIAKLNIFPVADVDVYPLLRRLWISSFVGQDAMEGIIYYESFIRMFKEFSGLSSCLYFSEMLGWEKALNAAKEEASAATRTVGYQHASVPKNYMFYYYSPQELHAEGGTTRFPTPDHFLCNGRIPEENLTFCRYRNLNSVEAIRYLYMNDFLTKHLSTKNAKSYIVLVATNINPIETRLMVELVIRAFSGSKLDNIKLLFKSHPACPIDNLLKARADQLRGINYEVKGDNLSGLLNQAHVCVAGSTAVGLEALAFGCEVVLPVFCEVMNMSPLAGYKPYYHKIYSADELKALISKLANRPTSEDSIRSRRDFVKEYWHLDCKLEGWARTIEGLS